MLRRAAPLSAGRVLLLSAVLWLLVGSVILLAGVLSGADGGGPRASDPCGPRDPRPAVSYPVSGFWLFPDNDPCGPRKALRAMRRISGDTVITSGPQIEARQVDMDGRLLRPDGSVDPAFKACARDGRTCYQAALEAVRSGNPANSITQIYAVGSRDGLGPGALRCPGQDVRFTVGSQVFQRMLLPVDDPAGGACDLRAGRAYALVLIAASTSDWTNEVLAEADALGMKVFVGLPALPRQPQQTWNVDTGHRDVALALNRVLLKDYASRLGGRASFAGVYQTFEVRLRRWSQPSQEVNLQAYGAQHAAVRELLPGRKILVSPYWDTRKKTGDVTDPDAVAAGIKEVARTGADIVAPQDGRGTGKGALYWDHEADKLVDPRLRPVERVGAVTYRQAYAAPISAYYAAAARARSELAREGRVMELWANVEGFEPASTGPCDPGTARGRTDKVRLDQAVMAAGAQVGKVVSFKWNGLYTCRENRPSSLADEITADAARPILAGAVRSSREGQRGVLVRGYQLGDGSSVTLTWQDDHRREQSRIVRPMPGPPPPPGASPLPAGMRELWVPFPDTGLARGSWIHIDAVNASGKVASNRYSLRS
ncbi:hypothetical protein GCM10009678_89860 [Actinomadura kijaniata]|uniref:DUF4434 domain-containing protein n=1 Tax=Actinomadura namibiensis TaxID=182080 RepID=A0A7W3LWE5_ACTNM|nr:DUF4434 domain-containing protein [Actinomadura namibiensis]MBA8955561.1 hypothetical protein [Actinomadura namibiensis]